MKKMNVSEMRQVVGGGKVTCPICGYSYNEFWTWLLGTAYYAGQLQAKHMRGGYYNGSSSVHKK